MAEGVGIPPFPTPDKDEYKTIRNILYILHEHINDDACSKAEDILVIIIVHGCKCKFVVSKCEEQRMSICSTNARKSHCIALPEICNFEHGIMGPDSNRERI